MTVIRLLGPVDVLDDLGAVHAPRTPLRRSLLALLALDRGHVVEPGRLLERLWDAAPPATGPRAVRFHLSRLRREVPVHGLIATVPGGYTIEVESDVQQVDAAAHRAVAADPHHRIDFLGSLLERWRGEPFVDAAPCDRLERERQRLRELRLSLTEQRYSALVDVGETTAVISELLGLCLEEPLREQLWGSLIIAQYRAGLQADALRSYDRLRRNLLEQLGADPTPELQELQRRVLGHDPTLGRADSADDHVTHRSIGRATLELIGRDEVRTAVLEQLGLGWAVTVTGVGGVGKTALARAVAESTSRTDVEVWWVELAPITDPSDIVPTIAATLGITAPIATGEELSDVLRRRGQILLVLDNCEHLAADVAAVVGALTTANVLVLSTSRAPLRVSGERVVRLGPLRDVDAVHLFVREARRRDPGFVPDAAREAVIDAICERLDRIPLAIELAAARSRSLGLGDIFDQLTSIIETRPHGSAHADRHATMSAAIRWSIELLEPDSAAGLGVLTVLAGTFDLRAAGALLDLVTDRPAFDVIDELVSHSLLEPVRVDGGLRYRLLEPIRQFATGELLADEPAARDRHAEHFLGALEEAFAIFGATGCDPLLVILEHDIDNLRAVHDRCIDAGRIDDDLRLYRPLMIACSHEVFEPGAWAVETLALRNIEECERWREALAIALCTAVFRSEWSLDDQARSLLARARTAGPGIGDDLLDCMIGWVECMRELRHAEGVARFDAIESNDTTIIYFRWLLSTVSRALLSEDPLMVGRQEYADGIAWARSIGARNLEAGLLMMSVHIEHMFGEPQAAHDIADEAAQRARATGMRHMEALALQQRCQAILCDAASIHDPVVDMAELMRGVLAVGGSYRLTQLLNLAAQVLATHDQIDAAALAGVPGSAVSEWQWHWREHIPDSAIAAAESRIEGDDLDIADIAELTIAELEKVRWCAPSD